ncbi:hypothetical protein [Microbacterium sp. MYb72]|uniref:hypothetical protein n=1 Tax=Microbacterium sp. MYb72 TaxID=1848693 RepID=UPI0015E334DB|nr:hypothetical protein [Microbacterium sp. MYb72]
MKKCLGCGLDAVDPTEPARYDVLRPDADLDDPSSLGPYCAECWPSTHTGASAAD